MLKNSFLQWIRGSFFLRADRGSSKILTDLKRVMISMPSYKALKRNKIAQPVYLQIKNLKQQRFAKVYRPERLEH